MRLSWKTIGVALVLACQLSGALPAQTPAMLPPPTEAANPAMLDPTTSPVPPQPGPCQSNCCDSFGHKLLDGILTPFTFIAGLVRPRNSVDRAGLAKPADTLDGAAARIKKDEAEARCRRDKVCYLATVDWDRYPEAEKALTLTLRTDPSESVRLQAALALANGCVRSPDTIQALALTVSASDKDGNPGERSAQIRQVAQTALKHCRRQPEPPTKLPHPGPVDEGLLQTLQVQYQEIHPGCLKSPAPPPTAAPPDNAAGSDTNTGKRGLFDIMGRAFGQGGQAKP